MPDPNKRRLAALMRKKKCNRTYARRDAAPIPSYKAATIGRRGRNGKAQKAFAGFVLRRPSPSTEASDGIARCVCCGKIHSAVACFSDAKRPPACAAFAQAQGNDWLAGYPPSPAQERRERQMECWDYRRRKMQPMRHYVPGEDMSGVSVSAEDTPEEGGVVVPQPGEPA